MMEETRMRTKILFIAVLLMAALNHPANVQTNEPRTVTDFYMQMPTSIIGIAQDTGERRKRIAIEDVANGYLKLKPSADQNADEYSEIALFKKTNGGYAVGVVNVNCIEICGSTPNFYERRADRWTDVTNRVFPVTPEINLLKYRIVNKASNYKSYDDMQVFWTHTVLPRKGRTVEIKYTGEGKASEFRLFLLDWNGERFVPSEALPKGSLPPVAISDKVLAAAETEWKPFFEQVKIAVQKRDRAALKNLMPKEFHYNCCDEGDGSGDNRNLAFSDWDGDPKDFSGWKTLDKTLRTGQMLEGISDRNRPMRSFDDATFEFGADGNWSFISYATDSEE